MWSFISLDQRDSFPSLKAKMEAAPGDTTVLEIPQGIVLLRDSLNLKLLRHFASSSGKEVLLVTRDIPTTREARNQGFQVFVSVGAIPSDIFNSDTARDATNPISRLLRNSRESWSAIAWVSLIAAVALPLLGGCLFLPSAVVTVRLRSEPAAGTFPVTADLSAGGVNAKSRIVPAHLLEGELRASAIGRATGTRDDPLQRAKGFVTFINLQGDDIALPKGTKVATTFGATFATTVDINMPSGLNSRATVEVEALAAGIQGNVPTASVNRLLEPDLAAKLAVINDGPTRGGVDSKRYYPTEDDIDALRSAVRERAKEQGLKQLKAAVGPNDYIYPETITIQIMRDEVAGPEDGSREIELKVQGRVQALAVRSEDLSLLLAHALPSEREGSYQVVAGSLKVSHIDVEYRGGQSISLKVEAEGMIVTTLDEAVIKRSLTRMSREESISYLRSHLPLVEQPQVYLGPFWVKKVPRFPWQVKIKVIGAD
ncbi:MAG: hypothetical protein HW403_1253 [Dehalococcoidia bacterium]|nr:hypothetical protein [Dehalococcoidia bacterium]